MLDLEVRPPEEFYCLFTNEIMQDPVIAEDGFTYERSAITRHLQAHGTSPVTNEKISDRSLFPNRALRVLIQNYLDKKRRGMHLVKLKRDEYDTLLAASLKRANESNATAATAAAADRIQGVLDFW